MPRYQRIHPQIIDPGGVDLGIGPRPMGTTSASSRVQTAYGTGGEPIVDFEGTSNPYNDYQSIDLLLSLQHPRSAGYDEHVFYIMGQVKELLFKGLHFELYNAQQQIRQDETLDALEILSRAKAALESPSLYDDVIRLLPRRGHAIDATALERDWSEEYEPDASVERAWLQVYAEPGPGNDLYRLAEALVALTDVMSQYRWRHFVSVQRLIGMKPGTGGSAGVGWLQHVTSHRFFPELWSIRTRF